MILQPLRLLLSIASLVFGWAAHARADVQLGERTKIVFASAADGRAALTSRDAFVVRMSPFDRSARLKTDQPVDEATYLAFAGNQALEWSADEQERVTAAIEAIKQKILVLKLSFPAEIRLIKTTGLEEGAAAYTRGTAIILPRKMLGRAQGQLESLLCHELFHVLSRHDSELREQLYRAIGFEPCAELKLPDALQRRRITNPDGPINDHCIRIQADSSQPDNQDRWAIPILLAKADSYDMQKGGEFFDYLDFKLIVVERPSGVQADGAQSTHPALADGHPVLLAPQEAAGFMEQIGRNTGYIIHPDEVLADNFVIIVQGRPRIPSPEVIARIRSAMPANP